MLGRLYVVFAKRLARNLEMASVWAGSSCRGRGLHFDLVPGAALPLAPVRERRFLAMQAPPRSMKTRNCLGYRLYQPHF